MYNSKYKIKITNIANNGFIIFIKDEYNSLILALSLTSKYIGLNLYNSATTLFYKKKSIYDIILDEVFKYGIPEVDGYFELFIKFKHKWLQINFNSELTPDNSKYSVEETGFTPQGYLYFNINPLLYYKTLKVICKIIFIILMGHFNYESLEKKYDFKNKI